MRWKERQILLWENKAEKNEEQENTLGFQTSQN